LDDSVEVLEVFPYETTNFRVCLVDAIFGHISSCRAFDWYVVDVGNHVSGNFGLKNVSDVVMEDWD
jgi:hypothetical protein